MTDDDELYQAAFSEGEAASFRDAKKGARRVKPTGALTPFAQAWWDGYLPRSAVWALCSRPKNYEYSE